MQPSDIPGADAGGEGDALRRLQAHLDRASGAAERLIAEAARASVSSAGRVAEAARGGAAAAGGADPDGVGPPPAGWQAPLDDADSGADLEVLAAVLHSLRDLIPPELQRRVAEALRELLLAVRALIDWYLERAEQRRAAPTEVQDIPIL
jgi:hypothetical protein